MIAPQIHSKFYLVIPPGFEQQASRELGIITHTIDKGGIELELPLVDGLKLNQQLRVPTRILLRLASFKCRDFPKLFNRIKKIDWRHWLWNEKPSFHIKCNGSRLLHTGKIEDAAKKAINESLTAHPFKKKCQNLEIDAPHIYIRVDNDLVTISIDTSYPALYIRGFQKGGHPASIRENIAYACWSQTCLYIPEKLASELLVIDPMCGSGTFLTEARELNSNREFAYYHFPITKYLPHGRPVKTPRKITTIGLDIDAKFIDANSTIFPNMKWIQNDLLNSKVCEGLKGYKVVISNPPYNRKIKLSVSHQELTDSIVSVYSPDLLALIYPKDVTNNVKLLGYKCIDKVNFRNGGFACQFKIWRKD